MNAVHNYVLLGFTVVEMTRRSTSLDEGDVTVFLHGFSMPSVILIVS